MFWNYVDHGFRILFVDGHAVKVAVAVEADVEVVVDDVEADVDDVQVAADGANIFEASHLLEDRGREAWRTIFDWQWVRNCNKNNILSENSPKHIIEDCCQLISLHP